MKCLCHLLVIYGLLAALDAEPIKLHPDNGHYFLFQGKPTIIVTSGEHYGAVLNRDFDYGKYLETLKADGLNNTRVFSGAYVEPHGAFNITKNTLAPDAGRFLAPWARSSTPGYANGGNKFDLQQWDHEYFNRLKDFMAAANRCGVIVEMNLFCPFYEEPQWKLSPQNAVNNINNIGNIPRTNVYTLDKHGGLLAVHEAMTRKIVTELNQFDNLYYEICNEPYFGGVTLDWQHRIAEVIVDTEKGLPKKHLVSRNVANGSEKIGNPHPALSVFNFHYASPPDAVTANFALNKVIGDNETGFKGTNDLHYRMEAWCFLLNGGGLYKNLDYSFVAGHEDGTFVYPSAQPGGGNPAFRKQLRILKTFVESFDFIRMKPAREIIKAGVPEGMHAYALGQSGQVYAIYIGPKPDQKKPVNPGTLKIQLEIPRGEYEARWLNPISGETGGTTSLTSDGQIAIESPAFAEDIALSIRKK